MKSKSTKRREAIQRMEAALTVPQEGKDDAKRVVNLKAAIANTQIKLKGDSYDR